MDPLKELRAENRQLKTQLVAVLSLSNEVNLTDNWQDRKQALEEMHREIQAAKPILKDYAVELMVD